MSLDPSLIESELRRMRAAGLDDSLLERLESCATGDWTRLSAMESAMEHELRALKPSPLPDALMARLEAATREVRFPQEGENILPFPERQTAAPRRANRWWASAAAVALCGALTAMLMPHAPESNPVAGKTLRPQERPATNTAEDRLVPAGFNRGLAEASDEGAIWTSNNQPKRVLKVVYTDRVTLKDSSGRTYQIEQPRVEYILVPAKAD